MIKKITQIMTLVAVSVLMQQCASLSRGDQIENQGSVVAATNSLVAPESLDLFLDQIQFKGHLGDDVLFNEHPDFEIHIMNEDESTLLACVGPNQKASLLKMAEDFITYGEIKAQFVVGKNVILDPETPIVARFIEKRMGASCPSGYQVDPENQNSDLMLAKVETTFGELVESKIEFGNVATAGFVKSEQPSWPLTQIPLKANGVLSADQLKISDMNFGEATSPELALMLFEKNETLPIACTDLWDIDSDEVTYGTLRYDFIDADETDVRLSDLDATKKYILKLVELDNGDCVDLLAEDTQVGVGVSILDQTGEINYADLVDSKIPLSDDADYVRLITR